MIGVNRITKQYIIGRDEDVIPPADLVNWIILRPRPVVPEPPTGPEMENPPGVAEVLALHNANVPSRHWNIDESDPANVHFTEMNAAQKAAVENALLAQHKKGAKQKLSRDYLGYLDAKGYTEGNQAFLLSLLQEARVDGLVNREAHLTLFKVWIFNVYAGARDTLDAINAAADKAALDAAMAYDLAALFDATKPAVSTASALKIPN